MYSLVYVGPGRKPKLLVFSCTGSNLIINAVTSETFVRLGTEKKKKKKKKKKKQTKKKKKKKKKIKQVQNLVSRLQS